MTETEGRGVHVTTRLPGVTHEPEHSRPENASPGAPRRLAVDTAAASCTSSAGAPGDAGGDAPVRAIEHVTVLSHPTGSTPLEDGTVVIRDGRIAWIGPAREADIPPDTSRVDGTGKWLMPALTDMHVHVENDRMMRLLLGRPDLPDGTIDAADLFTPYVANGVLQIVDMSAMPESLAQRDAVEGGSMLGPHVALAAMVDGSPPIWPEGMTSVAATPEDGRRLVGDIQVQGYDFVKVYANLGLATFTAIIDEARALSRCSATFRGSSKRPPKISSSLGSAWWPMPRNSFFNRTTSPKTTFPVSLPWPRRAAPGSP